jgi:hypothetical protein
MIANAGSSVFSPNPINCVAGDDPGFGRRANVVVEPPGDNPTPAESVSAGGGSVAVGLATGVAESAADAVLANAELAPTEIVVCNTARNARRPNNLRMTTLFLAVAKQATKPESVSRDLH